MNKHPEKSQKRPLVRVAQVISTILLICCTLMCFVVVLNAVVTKDANLFGFRLFYVISGSMEPTLPVGSLLVVGPSGQYQVGDVITFYSRDESIAGYPNTHRILAVRGEGESLCFVTKGDNNAIADADPVPISDVLGKVYLSVDGGILKKLVELVSSPTGFFLLILVPILVVAVLAMKDFKKAMQEELRRAAQESLQQEQERTDDEGQKHCSSE